ncbi:MAG: hypothetical protein ABI369_01040 [Acetobacteraceae bacterium]
MSPPSKTVQNEQRKLAATALNNLAVAFIVTGIIVPLVGVGYRTAAFLQNSFWGGFGLMWLVLGLGFHRLGHWILKGMKE